MKEIKGTINYTLMVDEKGENHSLDYEDSVENSIVGLLMATNSLGSQLSHQKQYKKDTAGKANKDAIGANISKISAALHGVQVLSQALLNSYLDYKASITKTNEHEG